MARNRFANLIRNSIVNRIFKAVEVVFIGWFFDNVAINTGRIENGF
jgi:hypothetical protein